MFICAIRGQLKKIIRVFSVQSWSFILNTNLTNNNLCSFVQILVNSKKNIRVFPFNPWSFILNTNLTNNYLCSFVQFVVNSKIHPCFSACARAKFPLLRGLGGFSKNLVSKFCHFGKKSYFCRLAVGQRATPTPFADNVIHK